jgi:hypothetical protein
LVEAVMGGVPSRVYTFHKMRFQHAADRPKSRPVSLALENNMDKENRLIRLGISTGVGFIAVVISWLSWNHDIYNESISLYLLAPNVLPFLISARAESLHSPNMPIFYISTFVQWFLLTLLLFWIKKRIGRKDKIKKA